jgi:hypothetical protein
MPTSVDPRHAIVSLWHRAIGANGEFLGSGAFVSPRFVLTARHVVENKQPAEIRLGLVTGQYAVPATHLYVHEQRDIALIELERDFQDQGLVGLDCQSSSLERAKVDLYGVNPDTKSRDQCNSYTVGTWDDKSGEYLFDHAQRKGFSGGIVVLNGLAVGIISRRHRQEQQGAMVPWYTVADWLTGFLPELARAHVPPRLPVSSLPQIPQDEFTDKVRDAIRSLLREHRGQPLHDAIVKRAGAKSAADALVSQQSFNVIDALDLLHHATQDCLHALVKQNPDSIEPTKEVAKKIHGWLVLLAVNQDQVHAAGCAFDPWQGGIIDIAIPLETEAGTEVLVASLGDRAAWFKLKNDDQYGPRVVGKDGLTADDLEYGIGQQDQIEGILGRIWIEVMKSTAPIPFSPRERKQLRATLAGRERRKENHYYITVTLDPLSSSPLASKVLLQELLDALPSLRVIYIGSEQGEGILLMDEYELWESIKAFLLMLRDIP